MRDDGLDGDLVVTRFATLVEEALRAAKEVCDDGALGAHFAAVGGAAEFQEGLDFAVETDFSFCARSEVGALGPGGGEVLKEVGEVHGVIVAVPGSVSGVGDGYQLERLTCSRLGRGCNIQVQKHGTWLILELEGQTAQQLPR